MMRSTSAALASGSGAGPGQSIAMLPGASGHSCGAPACVASRRPTAGACSAYVDRDELGGVLRGVQRVGDHEDDRLSHVHHALARQGGAMRQDEFLGPASDQRRVLRDVADAGRRHVGGGEHRQHPGRGFRRVDVDRADIGEGMRRADEIRMRLAGQRHIGRIAAVAAHEPVIFDARAFFRAI